MRIAIYPRKSVYRDNSDSVAVQIKMCKDYASIMFPGQHLEYSIYDKDEGFSGKNTKRPSFQELMADVRANKIDVVIVYKLDRISRNMQEFTAMYEVFMEHDVSFVSVKETFDTSTSIGRTVMYILAAFAQLERENTSERVADSMKSLGSAGKWTGGKLPAGMTSVRRKFGEKEHSYLLVDKNTIGLVKMLYGLILDGYSITKVERYCRDHGIKSLAGNFLSTSQIHNILTNPVYCANDMDAYRYFSDAGCTLPDSSLFDGEHGLIGYGKTRTTTSAQRKNNKNEWSIAIGIHEPVIAGRDWITVQGKMGANKMVRLRKYDVGILRGVLVCAHCGLPMHVNSGFKNNIMFSYYFCQTRAKRGVEYCKIEPARVRVDTLENAFIEKIKQLRVEENFIHVKKEATAVIDTSLIKKNIKETESAIMNLTTQLQENSSSTAAKYIIQQIETLDKTLIQLNSDLRNAEQATKNELTEAQERSQIYQNICTFLDNFDSLSFLEKKELIKKIVKTCTFDGTILEITF